MKKLQGPILFLLIIFLSAAATHGEPFQLRILHINDFHGFAEPRKPLGSDKTVGGIAYLSSAIRDLRKEKASLLLAAGDMIRGDNWANLFEGESVIEWMNLMKFDAMVV